MKQETRDSLCAKAIGAEPNEACGFILEDETIVECVNISKTPTNSFEMSGCDILDKLEQYDLSKIMGIWHSHPGGTTYPSSTDIRAITIGAIAKEWRYFIVTKDEVTEWSTDSYTEKSDEFWKSFL